ncbi:MAG: LysR family transcriptional regulator ArgP [Paracoccaceae bacterium]
MSLDPNQLAALTAILRTGSFDQAASELGVTSSAISQRLKMLEDHVGATLVVRGSPADATPFGRRLAKHAEDVGLLEAQLARDLFPPQKTGLTALRIALPADSLGTWVIPALAAVRGLTFDLVIDDQDHSADWLRRGDVSAAITAHGKPVTGYDSFALGSLRYVATASPTFFETWFAQGLTPEAFGRAPMMTFSQKDKLQSRWIKAVCGRRTVPPSHVLPSTQAFVDGALAGLGWGMNPIALVQTHITAGRLVLMAPSTPLDTPLYWQVSRIMAEALSPLTSVIRSDARTKLIQP